VAENARWIRLNVDWHESKWLAALPWHVRAVWPVIITHVKVNGTGGRCKAPLLERFAGGYDIPNDTVTALVTAANASGALRNEDDMWIIENWDLYQGVDASNRDRQKSWREKRKAENSGSNRPENAPNSARNGTVTALPRHATETETLTKTETVGELIVGTNLSKSEKANAPVTPLRNEEGKKAKHPAPSLADVRTVFAMLGSTQDCADGFFLYFDGQRDDLGQWVTGSNQVITNWQARAKKWINDEQAKGSRRQKETALSVAEVIDREAEEIKRRVANGTWN